MFGRMDINFLIRNNKILFGKKINCKMKEQRPYVVHEMETL